MNTIRQMFYGWISALLVSALLAQHDDFGFVLMFVYLGIIAGLVWRLLREPP